jgi:hypothetical protein
VDVQCHGTTAEMDVVGGKNRRTNLENWIFICQLQADHRSVDDLLERSVL